MIYVMRPRAQDDIIRQFRWYLVEQDEPETAFRFVDAVEATIAAAGESFGIRSHRSDVVLSSCATRARRICSWL